MTYQLPKRRTLVHKAIEPRNLSAKVKAAVEARTGDYWEIKYDGVHCFFVITEDAGWAFTRQGEPMPSMDHVVKELVEHYRDFGARGMVVFAEAWHPEWTHQKINGAARRQYCEGELEAVCWDMVPLEDFETGRSSIKFSTRRWALNELVFDIGWKNPDSKLTISKLATSKDEIAQQLGAIRESLGLEYATDGFMRKDIGGLWVAGSGSCGSVLKDKDIIDVDVEVLDVFEGKGKFAGMAGGFVIRYKGKTQSCGGGKLTTAQRKALWKDRGKSKIGCIIQVHGLSESEDGLLREPRFIRWREDKTEGE